MTLLDNSLRSEDGLQPTIIRAVQHEINSTKAQSGNKKSANNAL